MADIGPLPITGAARQYLQQKFGGFFSEAESYPVAGVAAAVLAGLNPDRLAVLVNNLGANSVYVGLDGRVSATRGFIVPPNGGSVTLWVDEDFTLVTRELWAISPGGNSQLYLLQYQRDIYMPDAKGIIP